MFSESMNISDQKEQKCSAERLHHYGDTFHDIFQCYLNNSHHSHSFKISVTGILVPRDKIVAEHGHKFKLQSDSKEYALSMSKALECTANKLAWEKVTVKGWLDFYTNILEVDKITPIPGNDYLA